MGVYIPNMSKPKSCYNHCNFIAMEEVGCPLNDYIESHQYKSRIHPDCPLIEIDDDVWESEKYKLIRMTQEARFNKAMAERRADGDI